VIRVALPRLPIRLLDVPCLPSQLGRFAAFLSGDDDRKINVGDIVPAITGGGET
jgi:hypothetical protein